MNFLSVAVWPAIKQIVIGLLACHLLNGDALTEFLPFSGGYFKLTIRRGYLVRSCIDYETLGHLPGFNNFANSQSAHRQWVQSALSGYKAFFDTEKNDIEGENLWFWNE